ncbi:MAG: DUF790 family protein [Myxococcales bacterium]|nr:DUF790 family protein [Myxococcales bacterium]MCB9526364.1 DUF790 family protein [Myxococcales bacterium]
MLTADLVRARRQGRELSLRGIHPKAVEGLTAIAAHYLQAAREGVGLTRDEVEDGFTGVEIRPADQKVADGLKKLVLDRCDFTMPEHFDPPAMRAEVFAAASAARKALPDGARLDREAVLAAVAEAHGAEVAAIEEALYADLRQSQRLVGFTDTTPEVLLDEWTLGQAQAVLLRAERVVATVSGDGTAAYRALFRALKFRRLLHRIEALADGGYRVTIDGPHSLFGASTKYGLQLALVLPAIRACTRWAIEADVQWGKERQALLFRAEGEAEARAVEDALPDEVAALVERLKGKTGDWAVRRSSRILDLPGVGLCVPDLVFSHPTRGKVYLEALGYWSREAVWKRVDLVEGGLSERILFCASTRLRVSEKVLGDAERGALYMYKGALSPKTVLAKIEALAP